MLTKTIHFLPLYSLNLISMEFYLGLEYRWLVAKLHNTMYTAGLIYPEDRKIALIYIRA